MNKALFLVAFIFLSRSVSAQYLAQPHPCAGHKMQFQNLAKGTVLSPLEDDYDVKHVFIDISATNLSTYLSGSVRTTAQVVQPNGLSVFAFELNPALTIDSVLINGVSLSVSSNNYLRTVSLPNSLPLGTFFTAEVFYKGAAVPNSRGINNISSPSWGNLVTYTLSEPYSASYWWPCKQSLRDKIDSTDIWITVPNHLKAGSMGLLENISPMPGNQARYEWKSRYPIDYYLISIAVAQYVEYNFHVTFPGTSDSVLVQNYVYNNPATLPYFKDMIDSTAGMLLHYSELFGRYPFWEEKYGHCMAPISGGMEHQTMTSLGNFGTLLVAHELMHQWFGNQVTCATWKDIWLNEGFASYGEYLFLEKFHPAASAAAKMLDVHDLAMDSVNGTLYVEDTANVSRVFNGRLTYNKGSAVVHTLRYVLGDSAFYDGMRQFLQQYNMGTATTEDLRLSLQNSSGQNLQSFFNQWVYQAGYPVYNVRWNQGMYGVTVELTNNNASANGVSFFRTPLDIRLNTLNGDTIVRLNQTQFTQTFFIPFSATVTSLQIDPNNWLMNEVASIVKDGNLLLKDVAQRELSIHPNPTGTNWQIGHLVIGDQLVLTDIQGRVFQKWLITENDLSISAGHLPSGFYLLQHIQKDGTLTTHKLFKK